MLDTPIRAAVLETLDQTKNISENRSEGDTKDMAIRKPKTGEDFIFIGLRWDGSEQYTGPFPSLYHIDWLMHFSSRQLQKWACAHLWSALSQHVQLPLSSNHRRWHFLSYAHLWSCVRVFCKPAVLESLSTKINVRPMHSVNLAENNTVLCCQDRQQ